MTQVQVQFGDVTTRIVKKAENGAGSVRPFLLVATLLFVAAIAPRAQASVTASPTTVSAFPSQTTAPITVSITYTANPRFPTTGTITVSGMPAGTTTSPNPVTYPYSNAPTPTTTTTTFSFVIGATTAPGTYPITLTDATLGSGSTTVTLVVNQPSFTASASPNPVTLVLGGGSQNVTITTTRDPGFIAQSITYSFVGFPAFIQTGANPTTTQASGFAPVVALFSLGAGAIPGTYSGFLVGTPNTGSVQRFPFTVIVQQPDIIASFGQPSMNQCNGVTGSNTINLSPSNGYTGTPQLSFTSIPAGFTVTPVRPTSGAIPPPQTIPFTVTANGVAAGTYTIVLNVADAAANINKNVNLLVTIGASDFTPSVAPPSATLTAGGGAQSVSASLSPIGCFNSSVIVSASGQPAGLSVTPGSQTLNGPTYPPVNFSVQAGATVPPGTYPITFTFTPAAGSGAAVKTAVVQVTVNAAPDFALNVTPSQISTIPGGSGTVNVSATAINGFSGPISVNAPAIPGVTFTPSTFVLTPGVPQAVVVAVASSATPQTLSGLFTATSPSVTGTRTAPVTIVVNPGPDFALAANPGTINVAAGGSALVAITATPLNGFVGPITVTSPVTPGFTAAPAVFTLPGGGSQNVTVTIDPSVTPGTYTLTFSGTSPAVAGTRTANVTFVVGAGPDFSLAATPATVTIAAGSNGSVVVSAAALNGFNGVVTVISPAGAGITFTPPVFTLAAGASQTVSIGVAGSVATGTYALTFTGTAPGVPGVRTANFTVNVTPAPDFVISAAPSALTIAAGGNGSVIVSASAINGFNGVVVVSAQSAPGVTLTPSTFTITAGASQSVAVAVSSNVPVGGSAITFTGTAPGVGGIHTATVALRVDPRPDFSLIVTPPAITLPAGASGTVVVSVTGANGFSGPVLVTSPTASQISFSPSTFVILPGASQTVTISTGLGALTAAPLALTFTASASGIDGPRTASLLLTVTPPLPIITAVAAPSVSTGSRSVVVRVAGAFFQPGALILSPGVDVTIEAVNVISPALADVTLSVRDDATPGPRILRLRNPDGGTTLIGGTLLVYSSTSLAAPLGVTSAAIIYPAEGTIIAGREAVYPRALLATTGLGTIIGSWQFDGVPFDRFVTTVSSGFPADVRAHMPIPISYSGGHRLELVIETPQHAVSPAINVIEAIDSASRLVALAPRDGSVVSDQTRFRWSLVPNTSGYLLELRAAATASDDFRPDELQPTTRIRLSQSEWTPTPEVLRSLANGLHSWRVRAIFPGETPGEPTAWQRFVVTPEHVNLVLLPAQGGLVRWSGGVPGLLYRIDYVALDGRVLFSGLTSLDSWRPSVAIPPLPAGSSVRVTALGPGGVVIGTSDNAPIGPSARRKDRSAIVLVGDLTVTRKEPAEGSAVKTLQPTIAAQWTGEVKPEEVSLVIDTTDVTAVTTVTGSSATYASLLPLAAGPHTVRLALRDVLTSWSFEVKDETAAAAGSPTAATPAAEQPATPAPSTPSSTPPAPSTPSSTPPAPSTPAAPSPLPPQPASSSSKATVISRDWVVTPVGTITLVDDSTATTTPPRDARLQISTQTDLASAATKAKVTGDVSLKHQLIDPNQTRQESRNWLSDFGATQGAFREEAIIGFAGPDFLDQSELLTTGLARGGAEGKLLFPVGTTSYYETFTTQPVGVVAGNFGPQQKVRAFSFQLPTNQRWDFRVIAMDVTDQAGFNSAGGKGRAYGIFGKYAINPSLNVLLEAARGGFDPLAGSAEKGRRGNGLRFGFSGNRGTFTYLATLRRTDAAFVNPANRGFTPGGVPDRTGGTLALSKLFGRTSVAVQMRHLQDGNSSGALIARTRETGGTFSITTMLGQRTALSLGANRTNSKGEALASLFLPRTDRAQSGWNATLIETVGRFSIAQALSAQQLHDAVNPIGNQKITTGTLTAGGSLSTYVNLSGVASTTRSAGAKGVVGTTDQLLVSLQPMVSIPNVWVSFQPRATYSRSQNDLSNSENQATAYQSLFTFAPPWLRSLASLQVSADWLKNKYTGQIVQPGFTRRYAATFSFRSRAGQGAAANAFNAPVLPGATPTAAPTSNTPITNQQR